MNILAYFYIKCSTFLYIFCGSFGFCMKSLAAAIEQYLFICFVFICRSKCRLQVIGGKIFTYKRRRGQSLSKNSGVKRRVHLVFDEDGNAADVNAEGIGVGEAMKCLPDAAESDCIDQGTSVEPEVVKDCLETDEEPTSCVDETGDATVVNVAESLTADVSWMDSTCTADATAQSESRHDDEAAETTASCLAKHDDELSKYWWQRYRLFSRFDIGIMIDRGR